MSTAAFIAILFGVCAVLVVIICLLVRKNASLKSEISSGRQTIRRAEDNIQEVEDVQHEISKVDEESTPQEDVPPPVSGDSASRLDRLNRL